MAGFVVRGNWRRLGAAFAVAVAGFAPFAARAEVALASLFTDGAVLQRDKPLPIWGTADAGEKITVTFAGQTRAATAATDGRWLAMLDPLPASMEGAALTVAGKKNTLVVHDVVVGEVWLCSGQSNMELTVDRGLNAEAEIAAARYPLLRHVRIERQMSETPADRVATSGWLPATPQHVGGFTAVGYFFARDMHEKLGVPVGLVHASWGGTPVEAWMSPMALASDPAFQIVRDRWQEKIAAYPVAKAEYDKHLAEWTAGEAAAKARGEKALFAWLKQNPKPNPPHGPGDSWTPTGLFNGMINPLLPYAVCGVLWYQGESNTDRPSEYHALFAAMITAWRAHFGQGAIPFYWVNLPNWHSAGDPSDMGFAWLRAAQTDTLSLPNTGQAIAIDIGDPNDIHPRNKQEVGRRLALLAKHRLYGVTCDDTGPVFASATREGAAMRVRFTEVSGGLISHDKPPQALEIAGADRVFHPAVGKIDRETLVVMAPEVREPVAVRYAWRNSPEANLYSGNGLPVVPFRSDNW